MALGSCFYDNDGEGMGKILLVDDQENIRLVAQLALTTLGKFSVQSCDSASAALSWLETNLVDLIISDLNMPEMDGLMFADELSQRFSAPPPVVLLTAEEGIDITQSKIVGLIRKPFTPTSLVNAVRGYV